jgi:CDP-glucose 4,6-dehydratase
VLAAMDSTLEPDVQNVATHEIREQYLDATRAKRELGWSPMFTLEDGLLRTIAWYRGFLGA